MGRTLRIVMMANLVCLAWPLVSGAAEVDADNDGIPDQVEEKLGTHPDKSEKCVAVADIDNYRHWLYWLDKPIRFEGGEHVSLIGTGPSGKHGICRVVFMPDTPPSRRLPYASTTSPRFRRWGRTAA